MAILHELTVLRRLQTNAGCVFSVIVIHTAQRYYTLAAWSRALPIAWSRAYCAITIMASNTKLTMDHDREIAELRSPLR